MSEARIVPRTGVAERVGRRRRFTRQQPCPVCCGYDSHPRGTALRCFGYLSRDGRLAHCTREDHAGSIPMNWGAPTFTHRLRGRCTCGRSHAPGAEVDELPEIVLLEEMRLPDEPSATPARAVEPIAWLVNERLPCGGTSLLVGPRDTGKSHLARQLALAVARGRPWLGFDTRRGGALYVLVDAQPRDLRAPFARLGLCDSDDVHLLCCGGSPELLARVRGRAAELRPALIVVDVLDPLLCAESACDPAHPGAGLEGMLALSGEIGAHVMLLHHLEGREAGALVGAGARSIDTILILGRAGGHWTLRSVQRRGDDLLEPLRIPIPAGASTAPVAAGRLREQVLELLRETSRLLTEREIARRLGVRPALVSRALGQLRERGRALQLGEGGWFWAGPEDALRRARGGVPLPGYSPRYTR